MKKRNIVLAGAWLCGIALLYAYLYTQGLSLAEVRDTLSEHLLQFGMPVAGVLFILLYSLRLIVAIPGTPFTLAAGVIFGPVTGTLLVIIGSNISANIAFLATRYVGDGFARKFEEGRFRKWNAKLQDNGFTTVLLMRLLFFPFDVVHIISGLSAMRQRDFALATFIGTLPGIITFVLLAGTFSADASGEVMMFGLSISKRVLVFSISAVFFTLGLGIARILKRTNAEARELSSDV